MTPVASPVRFTYTGLPQHLTENLNFAYAFKNIGNVFSLKLFFYFSMKNSTSASAVPIPAIPNFSINTLATFGDKNPGNVGPR